MINSFEKDFDEAPSSKRIDKYSQSWQVIETYCQKSIEELKNDLCSSRITHEKTQSLRGQIEAYRTIIDLPNINK